MMISLNKGKELFKPTCHCVKRNFPLNVITARAIVQGVVKDFAHSYL